MSAPQATGSPLDRLHKGRTPVRVTLVDGTRGEGLYGDRFDRIFGRPKITWQKVVRYEEFHDGAWFPVWEKA